MGLGETQVFQDEKSRLANTTVARIVAAKGSLNDPETKMDEAGAGVRAPVRRLAQWAPLTIGKTFTMYTDHTIIAGS